MRATRAVLDSIEKQYRRVRKSVSFNRSGTSNHGEAGTSNSEQRFDDAQLTGSNPSRDAIRGNEMLNVPWSSPNGYDGWTEQSSRTAVDGGEQLQRDVKGDFATDGELSGMAAHLSQSPVSRPPQIDISCESELEPSSPCPPAETPLAEAIRKLNAVKEELYRAVVTAYDPSFDYIPTNKFRDILNLDTIRAILPACIMSLDHSAPGGPDEIERRAEMIYGIRKDGVDVVKAPVSYTKILAVLIMSRKSDQLQTFLDHELNNSKLPVINKSPQAGAYQFYLRDSDEPLRCFDGWDVDELNTFYDRQWRVLAPIFFRADKTVLHYQFLKRAPLPFKEIDSTTEPERNTGNSHGGNFGEVFFVEIDRYHHNLPSYSSNKDNPRFAVKKLRSRATREDFDHEVKILKRLSTFPNVNLVKLLFTMELELQDPRKNEFFLIFPLASGDMNDLWKTDQPKGGRVDFVRWVAGQCLGVTRALGVVHGIFLNEADKSQSTDPYYGIHADIKPGNLLWYKDWDDGVNKADYELGIIQLADFGISNFHHTESRSNALLRAHTRTYRAPEIELGQRISRSFDIWGLGCVFIEFISWVVLGKPTDEFSNARARHSTSLEGIAQDTFYELKPGDTKTKADLNSAVKERATELILNPSCTQFVRDFVDLVLQGMLVVEDKPLRDSWKDVDRSHPRQLVAKEPSAGSSTKTPPVPKERFSCEDVITKLEKMIRNGDEDPNYYTTAKPVSPHAKKILRSQEVTVEERRDVLLRKRQSLVRPSLSRQNIPGAANSANKATSPFG
ncbi:kinase-like domain-containing protein [Podospora appendiculata]|uniref:Kinase-like domain-containing protein n=1 Tax=Podospora appendiculata TaxID=314037 RepID=A0AAE0WZ95_9PEZI|nr:kinase-like domain-containing protein [Podospora appendiculata]